MKMQQTKGEILLLALAQAAASDYSQKKVQKQNSCFLAKSAASIHRQKTREKKVKFNKLEKGKYRK